MTRPHPAGLTGCFDAMPRPAHPNPLYHHVTHTNAARRLMAIITGASTGDTLGTWLTVDGGWHRVEITRATIAEARALLTPEMMAHLDTQSATVYWRRRAAKVWPEFAAVVAARAAGHAFQQAAE